MFPGGDEFSIAVVPTTDRLRGLLEDAERIAWRPDLWGARPLRPGSAAEPPIWVPSEEWLDTALSFARGDRPPLITCIESDWIVLANMRVRFHGDGTMSVIFGLDGQPRRTVIFGEVPWMPSEPPAPEGLRWLGWPQPAPPAPAVALGEGDDPAFWERLIRRLETVTRLERRNAEDLRVIGMTYIEAQRNNTRSPNLTQLATATGRSRRHLQPLVDRLREISPEVFTGGAERELERKFGDDGRWSSCLRALRDRHEDDGVVAVGAEILVRWLRHEAPPDGPAIAGETGIHVRTVRRHVKRLVDLTLLPAEASAWLTAPPSAATEEL
jgi:hypothetical protein